MRELKDLTYLEYYTLKAKGLLWEYYSEATGDWYKDCNGDTLPTLPEWMEEGSPFDVAWNKWQSGNLSYSQFADEIATIEEVPLCVKHNHRNSADMLVQEINKAIFIYKKLKESDAGLVEDMLAGYDSKTKYGVV